MKHRPIWLYVIAVMAFVAWMHITSKPLGIVSTYVDPTDEELRCYLARYPELQQQFGTNLALARQHWFKEGVAQGRLTSCPRTTIGTDAEARCYLERYADLRAAFGNDVARAREHYRVHGFREGRTAACPLTDQEALRYLIGNNDLLLTFKGDLESIKNHWIQKGWREGKKWAPPGWLPYHMQGGTIGFRGGREGKGCATTSDDTLACNYPEEEMLEVLILDKPHKIALRSLTTNKYCQDDGSKIVCNRDTIGPLETFIYQRIGTNKIMLRGGKAGLYCADEDGRIVCNRQAPRGWETFTFKHDPNPVPTVRPPASSSSSTAPPPPPPPPPPPVSFLAYLRRIFVSWFG
jgi:hypothetical protein